MTGWMLAALLMVAASAASAAAGVGTPPRIVDGATTKFRLAVGTKQFRLACPVAGDNLMVQWKKDEEVVDWDSRYKLSKDDMELRMKNLRLEDTGRFQCQATNGFGRQLVEFTVVVFDPKDEVVSERDSIQLSSDSAPPAWTSDVDMLTAQSTPVRITLGGKLELKCPARGNPLPEIRWYKNGEYLSNAELPPSAVFSINSVAAADSGMYQCVLENVHGNIDATFKVRVGDFFDAALEDNSQNVNDDEESLVPVIDTPLNVTVRAGHTAQFQCKARAVQAPMIKWLKQVDDPVAVKRRDPNATVVFANGMNLLVLEQPQLESVSRSHPHALYANRLVIQTARVEDSGKYICVVTSNAGHIVYRTAHLQVNGALDLSSLGLPSDVIWVVVVSITASFFLVVCCAVVWLKTHQESPASSPLHKQPPPPRIPPPIAPDSGMGTLPRGGTLTATTRSALPPHMVGTPRESPRQPRATLYLQDSMFHASPRPLAMTLEKKRQQRAYRDEELLSNAYDSTSPAPYWPTQHSPSVYSGNYRTLEVGFPQKQYYEGGEYDQERHPFIGYRR